MNASQSGLKWPAFSAADMLMAIAMMLVLMAVLIPEIRQANGVANRAVCAGNLRGIIQAEIVYAQANSSQFSLTPGPIGKTYCNQPRFPSGWTADQRAPEVLHEWFGFNPKANQFQATAADRGNPLACLYLLVLQNYVTTKSFICPSDPFSHQPSLEVCPAKPGANQTDYYGNFGTMAVGKPPSKFGAGESYSMAYPWQRIVPAKLPKGPPGMSNPIVLPFRSRNPVCGPWWTSNIGSNVPVMSDMAPQDVKNSIKKFNRVTTTPLAAATQTSIFNSGNHRGKGQNVGYGDDHVAWCVNSYVGQNGDNIFTYNITRKGRTKQMGLSHTGRRALAPVLTAALPPFDTCMVPVRNVKTGAW